ncbi:MAG: malonate decarboxylase holo-[acyl-carrier-protein] synthase [Pseudoxanthomonas sp.]
MHARHALVWLQPQAAWQAVTPGAQARLADWFAAGHPAVVARRQDGDARDLLRLGVPLPPAEGKHRLALLTVSDAIARHSPPPGLHQVMAHAPEAWHDALAALLAAARAAGQVPRVFGSVAWQATTGLDYVQHGSDLDLLWRVESAQQADAIAHVLHAWEARYGRRADGEFLLDDGVALNWREYAGGAARLLVKAHDGCTLVARDAVWPARRHAS